MRLSTLSIALLPLPLALATAAAQGARPACAPDNGGITLPAGFCATVFADSLAGPRHLVVAPNGDVFVATLGRRGSNGGIVALRDANGDGVADAREHFGDFSASEVALHDGALYTETTTRILRYAMRPGALTPTGDAEVVVKDLPGGGHAAKTFTITRDGALYVNLGSETNSCQEKDRAKESAGKDPCPELEARAGIWRFDAAKRDQTPAAGEHYARGIRNAMGIAIAPDGALWVTQHGRDQLSQNWPALYTNEASAESPAEELFQVQRGDDFGWPYCYYDSARRARLLAPEYGGDGKTAQRCARKKGSVAQYPGHWAPEALLFYTGTAFPAKYRRGAFISFHGSWNRAPLPQAGFRVVFQPLEGTRAAGAYETFADGFASNLNQSRSAGNHRPMGLAQGPDGALYVSDDAGGRIWKIVYVGGR